MPGALAAPDGIKPPELGVAGTETAMVAAMATRALGKFPKTNKANPGPQPTRAMSSTVRDSPDKSRRHVRSKIRNACDLACLPLVGRSIRRSEAKADRVGEMRAKYSRLTIGNARRMRQEPTHAEKKLWWKLRELRERGLHFRRQAPFRNYILDFVEHRGRLVIELDGGQHYEPEHRARDAVRDKVLRDEGYIVLRFSNTEALEHLDGVVEIVLETLRGRPPTRLAALADLPTRGGRLNITRVRSARHHLPHKAKFAAPAAEIRRTRRDNRAFASH